LAETDAVNLVYLHLKEKITKLEISLEEKTKEKRKEMRILI
jgi:hypothetical protein